MYVLVKKQETQASTCLFSLADSYNKAEFANLMTQINTHKLTAHYHSFARGSVRILVSTDFLFQIIHNDLYLGNY